MKANEMKKASENLNEVNVLDVTTTKSGKKGGRKQDATEEKRSKTQIFQELRSLFELDAIRYEKGLTELCTCLANGKPKSLLYVDGFVTEEDFKQDDTATNGKRLKVSSFDSIRADWKKSCVPDEVTSIEDFLNRKGVKTIIQEIINLYGVSSFEDIEKVFFVREPEGLPSMKIYSKEQNQSSTLYAENDLFYRLEDLSSTSIIQAIAGAEVFINAVRVKANKQANDRKQIAKSLDNLAKRGLSAELLEMLKKELSANV